MAEMVRFTEAESQRPIFVNPALVRVVMPNPDRGVDIIFDNGHLTTASGWKTSSECWIKIASWSAAAGGRRSGLGACRRLVQNPLGCKPSPARQETIKTHG